MATQALQNLQTFTDRVGQWRRGESDQLVEAKVRAVQRTARTHARLYRRMQAALWRSVSPWLQGMIDEAKDGGIPMGGSGEGPKTKEVLMEHLKEAVEAGYRQGKQAVGSMLIRRTSRVTLADDSWDEVLPVETSSWLEQYVPELARVYEADVLQEVRDVVSQAVREGYAVRLTMAKLRAIRRQVSGFAKHRLEAIARTETMRAYNMGHLRSMIDADGVAGVEFSAIIDSRTSSGCQARDGLRFRLGDPRLTYNTPPLHPNCRSVLVPVLDVEEVTDWAGDQEIASLPETTQRDVDIEAVRGGLGVPGAIDASSGSLQGRQRLSLKGATVVSLGAEKYITTKHVLDRMAERGVSIDDVQDALTSPLYVEEKLRYNADRKSSKRYVGERATVNVNPTEKTISTAWLTGTRERKAVMKKREEEGHVID